MQARHKIFILVLFFAGCGMTPEKVTMDDPRIQPLLQAASSFDRAAFGFTPLPQTADVRWERRPTERYDAMLHIYGKTSRTIAFKNTSMGFKWIGEQESFQGPKKFKTPDGTLQESITLTYELQNISGYPTNRLNISYFGDDSRLAYRNNISLDYAKPVLTEWGY